MYKRVIFVRDKTFIMNIVYIKRILTAVAVLSLFFSCNPVTPESLDSDAGNQEVPGGNTPDNPDGPDDPDDNPDDPDNPGGSDNSGDQDKPSDVKVEVIDPGEERTDQKYTPQHPELRHEVEYIDFYNSLQDELDEYGNIDYVCSQGNGTSWPLVLENGHIRFYQGSSATKGGSYMRVRSKNGAKLLSVTAGSATSTKLAHSLNGKARKSETTQVGAGERYTVTAEGGCTEICFYCMGTSQGERWELDYIKVEYQGGFIESDFFVPEKEYGPLVRVEYPFTEDFEMGFPTTDTPSYYKYGISAGRDNLEWSTWYGSFSWQKPVQGGQSAQLRVYQEEEDYDQPQFGHLKMEFFLKDLSRVSFSYKYSEFWLKATISYCDFGTSDWSNPQQIALTEYSQRNTVRPFTYILDGGKPHDAKIRIEIDEATGFPSSGHYDCYFDSFLFE